jgi:hypothetical protein
MTQIPALPPPPRPPRRLRSIDRLLAPLFLIALGAWFLVRNLGVALPNFFAFWPLLIVFGGLWSIITWFVNRDIERNAGRLWLGLMGMFTGVVCLAFSLGTELSAFTWNERRIDWSLISFVWPAFNIAAGVAWLIQYAAEGLRRPGLLFPAFGALATGFVSVGIVAGMFAGDLGNVIWPLALIAVGVLILVAALRRR